MTVNTRVDTVRIKGSDILNDEQMLNGGGEGRAHHEPH